MEGNQCKSQTATGLLGAVFRTTSLEICKCFCRVCGVLEKGDPKAPEARWVSTTYFLSLRSSSAYV